MPMMKNIAGEVGLRTDRIHFLRQRGAGHHLEGDGGDAGGGEGCDQFRFVERIEKADVDRAFFQF